MALKVTKNIGQITRAAKTGLHFIIAKILTKKEYRERKDVAIYRFHKNKVKRKTTKARQAATSKKSAHSLKQNAIYYSYTKANK